MHHAGVRAFFPIREFFRIDLGIFLTSNYDVLVPAFDKTPSKPIGE